MSEQANRVRIGIVGPSWWVNYWHLPALQNHPDADIVAVCGTKTRETEEVAARYGSLARPFTDYAAMMSEVGLDGVIVCTPNDLHAPVTLAALHHNLHVTCEKPVAMNAAQAWEMAETARAKSRLGMCNFVYRDNPCIRAFRDRIQAGYLGRLLHLSGQYHGGFGLHRPPGWRGHRDRSGAGILGDLGSHLIDLTRYVTGDEFASVCAHSLTALRDGLGDELTGLTRTDDARAGERNDDSCAFLAELRGGAQALLHTSWLAYQGQNGQHQEIEAFGTKGRLHFVANLTGTFLRGMHVGEQTWETFATPGTHTPDEGLPPNEDLFRPGRHTATNTTYRWLDAIAQNKRGEMVTLSPDLQDGWRAQQVIDAVMQANRERRWIEIE